MRRFLGWEPSETRTVTHPDGTTTTITTTREPEWDDDTRAAALALHDDEADRCGECGSPRSECSDPDVKAFPQRSICQRTMEREGATREYDRIHDARPYHDGSFSDWAKVASDRHPYHYNDGVRIWVAPIDVNPDDDFLTDASKGGEFFG